MHDPIRQIIQPSSIDLPVGRLFLHRKGKRSYETRIIGMRIDIAMPTSYINAYLLL